MKNKFAYLLILTLALTHTSFGQEKQDSKIPPFKDIKLERTSGTEEIIINVKEETPILDLLITGTIGSGKLKVEVSNPAGKTLKSFTVKRKGGDKDKETSIGKISQFQKVPMPGNWKVTISSTRAYGQLKIYADFDKDYYISAPKSFTPDGDGDNDTFKIETYNIAEITTLKIYDKYGKEVFSTENIDDGWDGKINGKQPVAGTYFYFVTAKTFSGEEVSQGGYLTLSGERLSRGMLDDYHFMIK